MTNHNPSPPRPDRDLSRSESAHRDNHAHPHDQDHSHGHAAADFGRAFAIGTALNLLFVAIEAGYGFYANSMALLADAGHNLSDVASLVVAWTAAILAKRPPSTQFTYGLGTASILAALVNAILLLIAVVAIVWAALERIATPQNVDAHVVFWVAAAGIVINGATAMLFHSGSKHDLNVRGAFLHMAADAAVSLGVVIAALVIMAWGYAWLDPLISIAIAPVIVWSMWDLLRDSVRLSVHGVPPGIDADEVRSALAGLPGVESVHDLHIWPLSTTSTALSAHLVMPAGHPGDAFLRAANEKLSHDFSIAHATLQIEKGDIGACAAPCDRHMGHR
ncbi:MAG TPA: cation diffusion facilitator family transporter [Hyphomicrobium sp.]|nr:cation diffusion facilitator family transporter [Hyphomicrobium sp.]